MNTAAAPRCQTSGWGKLTRRARWPAVAAACWLHFCAAGSGAPANPPPWQGELDSLRLSDATITLLSTTRAAEAAEADRRLGELYRQLAARYPREPTVRKAAGDHFWRAGDPRTAVAEWEAAQALDPADADTASTLGSARLSEGRTREAYEEFRRAALAQPGVARHHFDLGNTLFLFRHDLVGLPGLPDEPTTLSAALAQLREARDLSADNLEYARGYAETFYGMTDPDWREALAAWEHVRELTADAPDFALLQLARVSLRLREPARAVAYLEKIRDPSFAAGQAQLRQQASRQAGQAPP